MKLRRETPQTPFGISFADLVFNTLAFFVFFTALLVMIPKNENQDKQQKIEEVVQLPLDAKMTFSIKWPIGPEDIDLWVIGPDRKPVGFKVTRSPILGYLRDDTGKDFGVDSLNYELVTTQVLVPGRYIMNIHFYDRHDGKTAVPVLCQVLIARVKNKTLEEIYRGEIVLENVKEERTAVQFDLDENGNVDPKSINHDCFSVQNVLKKN